MSVKQKEIYDLIISLLSSYFNRRDWRKMFLSGGCYWLANYLCSIIPNSYLVRNMNWEHCAICVNGKVYDVTGRISSKDFHKATNAEIELMQKEYVPSFNTKNREQYLTENLRLGGFAVFFLFPFFHAKEKHINKEIHNDRHKKI